jgi:dihydroorotase
MGEFAIRAPDDMHVHLRQGTGLRPWALETARAFRRALAMPNTLPPLITAERVESYRQEILKAVADDAVAAGFTPLMAFKLLPGMGRAEVEGLAKAACMIGKYYPAGATTNAEDGIVSPESVAGALRAMEALGIVLSVHAEDPDAPALEREEAFLPVIARIASAYPKLRIVVEHLSTSAAVDWVSKAREGIAATITAHHLAFCIDDMIGGGLDPHLFCKPVLKSKRDRDALRRAAFSGDGRFFFGSDSAPHPKERKESGSAPGGVFSSPVAMPLLAGIFIQAGARESLEAFCSANGARFYGLDPNREFLAFAEKPWTVPSQIGGAVPLLAGKIVPLRATLRI